MPPCSHLTAVFLGRDDEVWYTFHLTEKQPPTTAEHQTILTGALTQHSNLLTNGVVFGSMGSKNPKAAENSDRSQILHLALGHIWAIPREMRYEQNVPAFHGTRAGIKSHVWYWGPRDCKHSSAWPSHPWWIKMFRMGNQIDVSCYTSSLSWHTRRTPQILDVNLLIHERRGHSASSRNHIKTM